MDSIPFYSSVYTANAKVNTRGSLCLGLYALYQDSEKKRKYKLEDFDKCSFKVLLARSETEDLLDLLLTPSAPAERSWGKEVQTHQKS